MIPNDETMKLLELTPKRAFLINKYVNQGRKADISRFRKIISTLNEIDYKIKNGLIDPYFAIEEIIAAF